MKESKVILFDENDSERVMNNRIKKLEQDGWEVVEHNVSVCVATINVRRIVSFLLQREKNDNV